ncbi:TPA: ThiF family adenylyltransferase, partial [Klebsiella pneumoniae]|nr:ThiF family adenylyltransferase [Klebsiella pneumoniae]
MKLKIKSAEDLIQAITNEGFDTVDILVQEDNKYKARTIVLLGRDGLSLRTFYLNPGDEPTIHEFSIIWPSSTELRLSKESQRLTKIRIGIIGLGSMGSKIATSLARSGIKRFLLVDDDYLATSNIVRHELYWNHVGKHKVEGVKSALSLISAGIEVDESIIRLAG